MEGPVQLNGSSTQSGNYVWGAALTLAWKRLIKDIVKQPIKLSTAKPNALSIANNFNRSPVTQDIINVQCFYAMSGFGNQTVKKINKQVSQKFPQKTTPKISQNLPDDGIISYAYFLKNLKFDEPFKPKQFLFNYAGIVPGFQAKNPNQRKQVLVHQYTNDDNFIIQLKTKSQNDHIFLIKSKKKHEPAQILQKLNNLKQSQGPLPSTDQFQMPKISIKHKRDVNELKKIKLANQGFKQYFFSQIYEIINLDIDETGVKVENQGVMKLTKCKKAKVQSRNFFLNKPFWIIMRQNDKHPYFVAFINNVK